MLEINVSVLIQIANFLLLLLLLNIFLYRPIRKILTQRKEEMRSLENRIDGYQNRSEQHEQHIEEGSIRARKEGYLARETLKGEGLEEEKGIVGEAAAQAEETIGAARIEVEAKIAEVRKALDDQIARLSGELAEKILGRSIQ